MGAVVAIPDLLRRTVRWTALGAFLGGLVAGLAGFVVALATFPGGHWFRATIIIAAVAFVLGGLVGLVLALVRPRRWTDS